MEKTSIVSITHPLNPFRYSIRLDTIRPHPRRVFAAKEVASRTRALRVPTALSSSRPFQGRTRGNSTHSGQGPGWYVGQNVTLIGWLLTEKIVSTKKGEPMEFMTLEDQTGMYDATVFPNT